MPCSFWRRVFDAVIAGQETLRIPMSLEDVTVRPLGLMAPALRDGLALTLSAVVVLALMAAAMWVRAGRVSFFVQMVVPARGDGPKTPTAAHRCANHSVLRDSCKCSSTGLTAAMSNTLAFLEYSGCLSTVVSTQSRKGMCCRWLSFFVSSEITWHRAERLL